MYALPESCPFTGLFIPNPIYSTTPLTPLARSISNAMFLTNRAVIEQVTEISWVSG
ncbi:hypothetical protein [Serratia symbiotica]|uniref:hypothetical protein n=1 Tax=Serratia symbiotica TaxID=138074 RepID=UPI0030CA86EF